MRIALSLTLTVLLAACGVAGRPTHPEALPGTGFDSDGQILTDSQP